MEETDAYSHRDWVRAVNLSGVLGWLFVSAPITWGTSGGSLLNFLGLMVWAAAIGLPIAFGASWVISAPILKRIMRKKITWIGAAVWGGLVTFLIALVSIAIGRLYGLMGSASFQLGGGDKIREVDGILTAYGWLMLGQRTAVFVAVGVMIALLVRAVIGPGRSI